MFSFRALHMRRFIPRYEIASYGLQGQIFRVVAVRKIPFLWRIPPQVIAILAQSQGRRGDPGVRDLVDVLNCHLKENMFCGRTTSTRFARG